MSKIDKIIKVLSKKFHNTECKLHDEQIMLCEHILELNSVQYEFKQSLLKYLVEKIEKYEKEHEFHLDLTKGLRFAKEILKEELE